VWSARARSLAERTLDILSFLDRIASPVPLPAATATPRTLTYHPFCQSTNVLGIASLGPRLLQLAGLSPMDLPEASVCCGFGGAASIDYPEVGQGIVSRKLDNVRATGATLLCTDNPGCLQHLRAPPTPRVTACRSATWSSCSPSDSTRAVQRRPFKTRSSRDMRLSS
jgi:L-lactate dehydrogenase complex protein LldE